MSEPKLEAIDKTVLIIGDFGSNNVEDTLIASIKDKIIALGHTFQTMSLLTNPSNWIVIEKTVNQLRSTGQLLAVLVILSEKIIIHCSGSEYLEVWDNLLEEMNRDISLIFIREDNLLGKFTFDLLEAQYKDNLKVISKLSMIINKDKTIDNINKNLSIIKRYLDIMLPLIRKYRRLLNIEVKISYQSTDYEILINYDTIKSYLKTLDKGIIPLFFDDIPDTISLLERLLKKLYKSLFESSFKENQKKRLLIMRIKRSGVEIVPYKKKTEISIRVHHFLDEVDKGVFLHLYVPNGCYQEDQLASFLRLFESYMQRVEKLQFFIETRKTFHGQIYEFKSKNVAMNLTDMEVALSRFDQFMSLSQNDQKKAEALLLRAGINPSEASRLLTKYLKEYQRLFLDIEHERERKMLDLRQRLESEALELTNETSLSLTPSIQPSALLSLPDPISISISNSSVIINPSLQSYVEQAIYGDIHYTTEDKGLLALFEKHAERLESVLLRSELDQLKDTSSSEAERKTAKQKIVGFLSTKVAPAIGQSALTLLTAYLEKVLTGS